MQSKYAALALGLTVILTACGGGTGSTPPTDGSKPPVTTEQVSVKGAVAQGRSQEAVSGATVTVKGGGTTQTDSNGLFTVSAPKGLTEVTITKPGYASTRVLGLNTAETTQIEEILRPAFDPRATTTPPTMSLTVLEGSAADPKNWRPLATGEVLNTYGEDITVGVKVNVDSPEMNTFKTGVAALEVSGGTSGYLNTGLTRNFFGDPRGDTTSFTFKASELAAFKGRVNLHVTAYDLNGNRVHLIQPLNVLSPDNSNLVTNPLNIEATAVTFGDNLTFGAQSISPQASAALMEQISTLRGEDMDRLNITPQAAPDDASLWVDVTFDYPSKDLPRAFELWRSFDGKEFTKVMTSAPARVTSEDGYLMRDTSPLLTPGKEVFYRVRAVSDSKQQAGSDSGVASTTPLPRYTVKLIAPAQAQTYVGLTPTFTWESTGASSHTISRVVVLDRVQAEGSSIAWLSRNVNDKNTAVYNFDSRAVQKQLQPYHAYEWQLASITANEDFSAIAVAADYFNVFGLFPSAKTSVQSGPVHEFVTGGTQ